MRGESTGLLPCFSAKKLNCVFLLYLGEKASFDAINKKTRAAKRSKAIQMKTKENKEKHTVGKSTRTVLATTCERKWLPQSLHAISSPAWLNASLVSGSDANRSTTLRRLCAET